MEPVLAAARSHLLSAHRTGCEEEDCKNRRYGNRPHLWELENEDDGCYTACDGRNSHVHKAENCRLCRDKDASWTSSGVRERTHEQDEGATCEVGGYMPIVANVKAAV